MKFLLPLTFALFALAAACGGGGGAGPTPLPAEPSIDPNLLSSVVLQPADMPPEYTPDQTFNPPGAAGTSFSSSFHLGGVTISSGVIQYPDVKTRDQNIDHLRRGLAKVVGPETAYRLAGADAAFLYLGGPIPAQASLVLRGRYVNSLVYQTTVLSQAAAVTNRDELEQFTHVIFERLQKLLADPSSITPIAGAPTFDPAGRTAPAVATRTPGP